MPDGIADGFAVRLRALRLDEEHHTVEHQMGRRVEYEREPRLRRAGVKPGADSVAKGVHREIVSRVHIGLVLTGRRVIGRNRHDLADLADLAGVIAYERTSISLSSSEHL